MLEQHRLIAERAALDERRRIAQEMHDVLGHKISIMVLHAGVLELAGGPHAERAALIRKTGSETMQDLHEIIGVLRGTWEPPRATQTGRAALEELLSGSRSAGLRVEAVIEDGIDDLDPATSQVVHRVVQEALTNVHKHAGNALTIVRVRFHTDRLTVDITNHKALTPPVIEVLGSQQGLLGLRERVSAQGGRFECGRTLDGGFRVWAELPTRPQVLHNSYDNQKGAAA